MRQRVDSKRKPSFCWAANDAIAAMVEALDGRDLNGCLGAYQALTHLASRASDGDHEGFEETRTELARVCGLSTRRLRRYIDLLASLNLLEVDTGGGSRPNTWRLVDPPMTLSPPDNSSPGTERQGGTERQRPPGTERQGVTNKQLEKKKKTPPKVPPAEEFEAWLDHYREVTGRPARGSASARRAFAARRREQWSLGELKMATVGCHADRWRREQGYDVPDTILRASKVEGYLLAGYAATSDPHRKLGELVETAA